VILQAPPAEFIPAQLHGKPVLGVLVFYIGQPDEGGAVVAPLKRLGSPAVDLVAPMPYTAFQATIDPFSPRGMLYYTRGIHLSGLTDEAIDTYVDYGVEIARASTPLTQSVMFRHGGAVSRVADDATAAGHRDAAYMAHPFSTGGVYLNFEPDEGEERVRAGYGAEKYARLVALKDKWDPDNLFRVNQNIKPSRDMRVPAPYANR